ncbi:hypothetical protein PR048_032455 [Dryococelus australis]|uniref:Uncharacterized protein n=1 Tax=Dryococelus australis TaxID=614101 RepID=A0ABQ9G292_9NEOP|nr:hypothetical protein PR048_032455 [Dryococelus australis]
MRGPTSRAPLNQVSKETRSGIILLEHRTWKPRTEIGAARGRRIPSTYNSSASVQRNVIRPPHPDATISSSHNKKRNSSVYCVPRCSGLVPWQAGPLLLHGYRLFTVKERVEFSTAKEASEFTCSEYWDMAMAVSASGGQAPCTLHASDVRKSASLWAEQTSNTCYDVSTFDILMLYADLNIPSSVATGSCQTMTLVGGFSRGLPVLPSLHSDAAPYSPPFTLVGSQDLDVRSRPNLFIRSRTIKMRKHFVKMTYLNGNECVNCRWSPLRCFDSKSRYLGAMVVKRLDYSPPIKANRVRFPAGSPPDFRMWESRRTMPLVGGFSRRCPVSSRPSISALLHTYLASPSSALKTSMLRAAQIYSLTHSAPFLYENHLS